MQYDIKRLKTHLSSLTVYRHLLEDPVIKRFNELLDTLYQQQTDIFGLMEAYHSFCAALIAAPVKSFHDYLLDRVLLDETPYSLRTEQLGPKGMEAALAEAFSRDLETLSLCAGATSDWIQEQLVKSYHLNPWEREYLERLPRWPEQDQSFRRQLENLGYGSILQQFDSSGAWSTMVSVLTQFFAVHGSGHFARCKAFLWDRENGRGKLTAITRPDNIRLSDLIGYQQQRDIVLENTRQLILGKPANNVLLYGDRGTGKSSTVKALLHEFHDRGLRLIEVPKRYLLDLPAILRIISGRRGKFILFIDDLAFNDDEETYTSLKAVMEGGIAAKPSNVVIYATSNRRHLIKETFGERAGLYGGSAAEEIHAADTVQEKLSFADRFGITVAYTAPGQKQYLDLVDKMAARRGLVIASDALHQKALQWELLYNGRSPRTAKQFIDWLAGQEGL